MNIIQKSCLLIFVSFSSFSYAQSDCYWDFEDCASLAEGHIYGSLSIYGEISDIAVSRFIRDLRGCFNSYDACSK